VQRGQHSFDDLVFPFEITQFFSFKVVFGLADFLFNIAKPLLAVLETFDKRFRVGAGERERNLLFHRSLLVACCNQWSDLDFWANAARPCLLKFLAKGVAAIPVPGEKSNHQIGVHLVDAAKPASPTSCQGRLIDAWSSRKTSAGAERRR
jgi:hypothetical protein